MKKRLISILLTVLMVMSLFSGMSVSAYADDVIDSSYYTEYTMKEGDYVLRICQRMGINYYTCKEAIMALNNILGENGFRYIGVGEVIKIPVSDAHAIAIMKGQAVNNNSSSSSAGGVADVQGTASVAYYLVPHAMAYGETVLAVCNALGTNFTNNAELIKNVNGIKNWNNVHAGSTVLIPVYKTPAVGTTCYAVMNHKIVSGETTYGICGTYGISYGGSQKLMQAVNGNTNLAAIKAGASLKVPVVTTIKAASTGSSNTADKNNTTNNNTNNTTNNNNTSTSTAKLYDINANINTQHGTMAFYVNNKAVSTAAEGDVVTVVVSAKDNKAVESLVVKYADGRADVKLESNSFIMPGCDVRIDAVVKSGYEINIESNNSFKTASTVDGISTSSAAAGKSVKIVSTDSSYEITNLKVVKTGFLGIKAEIPVNDNNSFVMPENDVTVKVELSPVKTYNFYRDDTRNGSFDIQVDGFSVSKAAKGAQVTVVWQPASGYEIGSITVTKHGTADKVNVFNNSFTMPDCDVDIEVRFVQTVNRIEMEAITGAVLRAYPAKDENDTDTTNKTAIIEANTDSFVVVKAVRAGYEFEADDGYKTNLTELIVTRNSDGHRVNVTLGENGTFGIFRMPSGGVTITGAVKSVQKNVTVKFYGADNNEIVKDSGNSVTLRNVNDNNDYITAKDTKDDAANTKQFAVGTKIRLSTDTTRETHNFIEYKVFVDGKQEPDQELSKKANQGQFTMPNAKVEIRAYFSAAYIAIPNASITGPGSVSYMVSSDGSEFASAIKAKIGDLVKIVAVSTDAKFSATERYITVTDKGTGDAMLLTRDGDGYYYFRMPADGVDISVNFYYGVPRKLHLKTVDATDVNPKNLQGKNLWGMYISTQSPADKIYENSNDAAGTLVNILSGEPVIIFFEKELTDKYVIDRVLMESTDTGAVHENGLEYNQGSYRFFMANEDLTVTVFVKEKASNTHSLLDISYDKQKMTVGCVTSSSNNNVVTTAKEGEIVFVKAQVKNTDEYKLAEDGITITKKSSDNVGKGSFVMGTVDAQPTVPNTYYPQTDGNGNVIGWKYIMPDGGVNVSVACQAKEYDITLIVKDTNGNTAAADGTALNAMGYVVINTTEADVSTARQVSSGIAADIAFNSAVKVTLSEVGASLYTIKSVAVEGVTVTNNGFWMPAKDAQLLVELQPKVVEPTTVSINTGSLKNGSIQYYADEKCTQLIPNNKAEVGKYVYAVVTPNTGYKLKSFSAINSDDKTVIADMTKGNEGNGKFSMQVPDKNINVAAEFELESYTLTVNLEVEAHAGQVKVQIDNGTVNTINQVNGTTVPVPYGSTVKVTLTDTGKYTLVDVPVTPADSSVAAVSVSKNASSANFKMPASNASITVDLNSK